MQVNETWVTRRTELTPSGAKTTRIQARGKLELRLGEWLGPREWYEHLSNLISREGADTHNSFPKPSESETCACGGVGRVWRTRASVATRLREVTGSHFPRRPTNSPAATTTTCSARTAPRLYQLPQDHQLTAPISLACSSDRSCDCILFGWILTKAKTDVKLARGWTRQCFLKTVRSETESKNAEIERDDSAGSSYKIIWVEEHSIY